jgi:hypothetical protein
MFQARGFVERMNGRHKSRRFNGRRAHRVGDPLRCVRIEAHLFFGSDAAQDFAGRADYLVHVASLGLEKSVAKGRFLCPDLPGFLNVPNPKSGHHANKNRDPRDIKSDENPINYR